MQKAFNQRFSASKIPEFYNYYFDYNSLRKSLKKICSRFNIENSIGLGSSILNSPSNNLQKIINESSNQDSLNYDNININDSEMSDKLSISDFGQSPSNSLENWVNDFKKSIDMVNDFYNTKLLELQKTFTEYSIQTDQFVETKNWFSEFFLEDLERNFKGSKDELENATSWNRAYSDIFKQLRWLYSFSQINMDASFQLINKFKKYKNKNKMEINNLESFVLSKDFVTKIKIKVIKYEIVEYYSTKFTKNDRNLALKVLDESYHSVRILDSIYILFLLGTCVSLLGILGYLTYISGSSQKEFMHVVNVLPIFRLELMICVFLFGAAFNIFIFRKYGVNYIFIFELDPNYRIRERQIMKIAMILFSAWLVSLNFHLLEIKCSFFQNDYAISPIFFFLVFCFIFFNPFKMFYRKARIELAKTNLFILLAPFLKVRYKDFFLADIYCSFTRSFQDIVYTICFYSCGYWRTSEYYPCSYIIYVNPILFFLPFNFRFWQCIHKLYETPENFLHLINAGKYFSGMVVGLIMLFCAFEDKNMDYGTGYFIACIISSIYIFFWDLTVDWGLLRFRSLNFLLRQKILYPIKLYYWCMISNFFLKFGWMLYFFLQENIKRNPLLRVIINSTIEFLEVYRRTQCCFLRVENENNNNFENYRTMMEIPELPVEEKALFL